MKDDYCINFERSGGFMGRTIASEICSKSLSDSERLELDNYIFEADLLNYIPGDSVSPGFPDQFQYDITIEKKTLKKSLRFNDSNMPDQFRPLVNYLIQSARNK